MRKLALSVALAFAVAGATAASASTSVLLGDQAVTSHGDSNNAGVAQAFQYTASASGIASDIDLYVNNGTSASEIMVGVYSDSGGKPSALLASGALASPKAGSWNDIKLSSTATLSQGRSYWIALLGTGGQLKYPDTPGGSSPSYVNANNGLTSLPQTYSPGKQYNVSPASAYVKGTPGTAAMLVGDQSMAPSADSNVAGVAQAFAYSAAASGTTSDIDVYVNSGTTATKLMLGVYSDAGGKPGSLLASGSLSSPKAGAWNDVSVGSTTLTAGTAYWIALLGTGGQLNYPDTMGGSQASYVDSSTGMTALPASYASGTEYNVSPASAYVNGFSGSAPSPPVNASAPAITGSAVQGQTLAASTGSWTNSPTSYGYQWQDCDTSGANCTNISGATANQYALASGDVGHTIRVAVAASNAGGSASASSAQTAVVTAPPPAAPANTGAPVISGSAVQGQTLAASTGSWTNSPTSYGYQWQDCNAAGATCSDIGGATSSTYALASGDVGHTIRVAVAASNAGGSASASSAQTAVVTAPPPAAPANTGAPVISGSAVQGQTLAASTGSWTNSPTSYGYQWQDCDTSGANCTNISGATANQYALASGDVGHTMRVAVTATNAGGSGSASSGATAVVASSGSGGGGGIFVSQSGSGAGTGADCSNAKPVSFFNSSANWGTGSGKIGPGVTVNLCGTISTGLVVQGSGTSGSPITVFWQPAATMSAPDWTGSGAISTNGQSYLTFNGGNNGTSIQATADGTGLADQGVSSKGISASNCTGCMFENLTIANLYVHTSTSDNTMDQTSSNAIKWSGSNVTVANNTVHDVGWALWYDGSNGNTNDQIYGNNISNIDHGIIIAPGGTSLGTVFIFGNHIHDQANWDCGGGCHHDPIHCFGSTNGTVFTGFYIYDNRFDGSWGSATSSATFLEGNFGSSGDTPCTPSAAWIFNNVAMPTDHDGCCGILGGAQGGGGFFNDTTRGANNTEAVGPCMGVGGYSVNGTNLFENNIMDTCNTLFSGVAYGGSTKGTTAAGDPDYDAYVNGGSNAFSGTGPTGNHCSDMPWTAFASWKSCMGGIESHDPNTFATDAAAGINTDGSLTTGSPLNGAGNNLTSTCNTFPTTPANVQAACQTTYTGPPAGGGAGSHTTGTTRPTTGAWNAGAY